MEIRRIAILGSGRLGRGIAENAASRGYDVTLFSQGAGSQGAPDKIEQSLDRKLAKWAITESEKRATMSRVSFTSDLQELGIADLMIEATIDHLYTKQELLRTADRLCRPEVVFLLTSATLGVSELARSVSRSELLVGLRFNPPVPRVPVVELSHAPDTSPEAVKTAEQFATKLGKQVVYVAESPGLINPRALVSLVNEGALMLDEGVTDAESLENTLKACWGMDHGPLEMADRMGLDVILQWMEDLHEKLGSRYQPAPLIRRFVRQGRLGVKAGHGFFHYDQDGGLVDVVHKEQED